MTKENQKIMYDNFMRLSKEGTTDIQRKHCLQYAKDILKSWPEFEGKKPEPEKPKEEKKVK